MIGAGLAVYRVGDVRKRIAELEPGTVDLVLTSPPFLRLRSYLEDDHPDKELELGSERTPGEFVDHLLDIVEALEPALAPHASLVVELGDTYAGSGGAGGDYDQGGLREGQLRYRQPRTAEESRRGVDARNRGNSSLGTGRRRTVRSGPDALYNRGVEGLPETGGAGWPLDRSLCMVPETFRFALVYGFNPLTGRATGLWRARNVLRWCRPNPPVGDLGDKFRPATTELVVACKSRRYFDLDGVRSERPELEPVAGGTFHDHADDAQQGRNQGQKPNPGRCVNPAGAPPLDWWKISTEPYPGAHYATWPRELCVVPIEAMCPPRVCRVCGRPSERIVEVDYDPVGGSSPDEPRLKNAGPMVNPGPPGFEHGRAAKRVTTVGWTDCGHDDWRPGLVLDPFAGSGTTLAVATGHGRAALGFDLDGRNADLAVKRVGPLLLTVEGLEALLAP